jgi:hypothetical protein
MRRLTSEQYLKIDAVAQTLPPSKRHAFLVKLAGKISRDARVSRARTVPHTKLSNLIDAALYEMRDGNQRPADPHAAAAAKELDRLIKMYSNG